MQVLLLLFSLFVLIQIIYLGLYLFAIYKHQPPAQSLPKPVSVIVCAHNEEENLRALIPLLLSQNYPEFEVIVVDDRSDDGSVDFLRNFEHPQLRKVRIDYRPDHIAGKKFALTLGIKAAKFDWLLLTDADCRPKTDHWINTMSKCFSNNTSIVLGYSPYTRSAGFLNLFIRYESLFTAIQYLCLAILGKPYMGVGRNLAYRKSLFFDNKGFRSHLDVVGGDDDLFINETSSSTNVEVCIGEEAIMYTRPKVNWNDFFHQKIRHLAAGKNYKFSDKAILGLFHISLVGSWLIFVPLMAVSNTIYVPLSILLMKSILLIWLFNAASRKLGEPFEAWKVPFLDFIFSIYYLVAGLVALQTNKIRWKKT